MRTSHTARKTVAVGTWLAAALLAGTYTVGCIHHHHHDYDDYDRVVIVDDRGWHHEGYYDRDRYWHGGYYDEHRGYHEDARDWHRDRDR